MSDLNSRSFNYDNATEGTMGMYSKSSSHMCRGSPRLDDFDFYAADNVEPDSSNERIELQGQAAALSLAEWEANSLRL